MVRYHGELAHGNSVRPLVTRSKGSILGYNNGWFVINAFRYSVSQLNIRLTPKR